MTANRERREMKSESRTGRKIRCTSMWFGRETESVSRLFGALFMFLSTKPGFSLSPSLFHILTLEAFNRELIFRYAFVECIVGAHSKMVRPDTENSFDLPVKIHLHI